MLKKTITYPDLDGNPVTEDFYFNLSKAEIAEMELSHEGGLGDYLQRIVESEDGSAIISMFKEIIGKAIGRRSEDGRRFVKSEEITNDFMQTEAYSKLFMEFLTDPDAAANFIKGIVPSDMKDELAKKRPVENLKLPDEGDSNEDIRPAYVRENRDPTPKELQEMNDVELRQAFLFRQHTHKQAD